MDMLWPLVIVLSVGLALIALWALGHRIFTGTQYRAHAFWCPFRGLNVRVHFKEAAWDGRLVDVERCTAFAPPTDVGCGKACTELPKLPAVR